MRFISASASEWHWHILFNTVFCLKKYDGCHKFFVEKTAKNSHNTTIFKYHGSVDAAGKLAKKKFLDLEILPLRQFWFGDQLHLPINDGYKWFLGSSQKKRNSEFVMCNWQYELWLVTIYSVILLVLLSVYSGTLIYVY